ncbi:MAG: hypothetical protein ACOH1M_09730 [Rhodoglobus sp.]
MITPEDIPAVAEDVARRIIVAARSIAPCIDSFLEGSEEKKNAIAILRGVAAEIPVAGSRRVRSQRMGPASADYWNADTWLPEDRRNLRSLCSAVSSAGNPIGSFPQERALANLWPEKYV